MTFLWCLTFRDVPGTRLQGCHALRIQLNERRPSSGDFRFLKDRLNRALRPARIAVDAVVGIDIELPVILVKTFARANDDTIGVLAIATRLAHDIGHDPDPSFEGYSYRV
jgi:hypothetical protein